MANHHQTQATFSRVTLVEGYSLASFTGSCLVALRDTLSGTVLTAKAGLQSLFETAGENQRRTYPR